MAIQDLVLDALGKDAPEERVPKNALDTLHGNITPGQLLHGAKEVERGLSNLEGREFHYQVSLLASSFLALGRQYNDRYHWNVESNSSSLDLLGAEIFSRSADYLQSGEGREELLAFIHQAIDNHYLKNILSSSDERIALLQDVWREETVRRLAELGSVQMPTAKRWMAGAHPASAVGEIKKASDIIFHLRSSTKRSNEEIAEWFDRPLQDGQTPFQHVRLGSKSTCRMGEVALDPLTRELESIGVVAFSWAADISGSW